MARHAQPAPGVGAGASVTLVPLLAPRVAAVVVAARSQNPGSSWSSSVIGSIHFALFQKYRCGTIIRTGPPCSIGSGRPSCSQTIQALPPVMSSSGRLVV